MLEIFGNIPLWAILIIIILIAVVAWKLIKFAIKILIVVVMFFAILIGLDVIGVFTWINENIISSFM
ncbi:MAG: hypothetical protein KAU84_00560 [Thermoplasmatales archaeon]|nr:hypothetical protein [Thermoplasmatales archaeon]